MQFIEILKVIFLGIVEGITEWLPISSTGHLLLIDSWFELNASEDFKDMFFVVIQLGAILAVVALFFKNLFPFSFQKEKSEKLQVKTDKNILSLWGKILVACVPAGAIGILFDDFLDAYLHTPLTISLTLIAYGIAFLFIEKNNKEKPFRIQD